MIVVQHIYSFANKIFYNCTEKIVKFLNIRFSYINLSNCLSTLTFMTFIHKFSCPFTRTFQIDPKWPFAKGRARTKSIHFDSRKFDSPKWIKNYQIFFDFWFTWENHFIFDSDSFWFTIYFDFCSFWFEIQIDFIHFDSVWFDSSRIRFTCKSNSNRIKNQRLIVIPSFANRYLIRFRIKSEPKWIANQAGPSPGERFIGRIYIFIFTIPTFQIFSFRIM